MNNQIKLFQSTHSLRSATYAARRAFNVEAVSIHALLAECDGRLPTRKSPAPGFQSTHSLRSATFCSDYGLPMYDVSIHALLAECDSTNHYPANGRYCFNPRTPCGVRRAVNRAVYCFRKFQSTHSLRSATIPLDSRFTLSHGFNPRTPCGVRLRPARPSTLRMMFQSTHSLRSATSHMGGLRKRCRFQSTHSLRSATLCPQLLGTCGRCFNPRTPCGVRRTRMMTPPPCHGFQSTHSLRSATLGQWWQRAFDRSFNPRTPCGVRPISIP